MNQKKNVFRSYLNNPFERLLEELLHEIDLNPHHAVSGPAYLTVPVLGKSSANLKV
jgi:hypothetical protein